MENNLFKEACEYISKNIFAGDEKSKTNGEWISVSNEKPQEGQEILMTYNYFVMEGKYANRKFYYPSSCSHVIGFCQCEEQEGITHWMPLPIPPEEENGMD